MSAGETRAIIEVLGPLDEASPQLRSIAEALVDAPPVPADALARLALLEQQAASFFEELPILLAPAAAEPAFALGGLHGNVFDLFHHCKLASALGLPAAVVPVAMSSAGLPIGVQVIGRRSHEAEVLAVARSIENRPVTIAR